MPFSSLNSSLLLKYFRYKQKQDMEISSVQSFNRYFVIDANSILSFGHIDYKVVIFYYKKQV